MSVEQNELDLYDDLANSEQSCEYFECYIHAFSLVYDEVHIPLSISICLFGALSNVLNIIVLTRRRMRTPINILLTGLSLAQWLLATNYLSFLILEYYRAQCIELFWSKGFTWYRFFNVNLNTVFHTIAFTTTIIVAVFRYCALRFPIKANRLIYKSKLAVVTNIIIWIIVPLISLPVFFISEVKEIDISAQPYGHFCNTTGPIYDLSYLADQFLISAVFWAFGIVFKLLPSSLLTVLLIALIRSLNMVEKRRKKMKDGQRSAISKREKKAQRKVTTRPRTTRMLVIILLLCVMVEFPMGFLNLCVAVYGSECGSRIYDPLGNFMEMLTLLYSSVSFVLYCTMSNDFLLTFRSIFLPFLDNEHVLGRAVSGSWKARKENNMDDKKGFLLPANSPSSFAV